MVFSSKAFFIFLPIILLLYHSVTERNRKYLLLLLASWFFYAWCSAAYIWVILLITAIDYQAALRIEASGDERVRRRWLWLSVGTNLGLLAFFKYTVFVVQNTVSLAQLSGFTVPDVVISIALPLGISFHTFQGVAYTIDVYRGQVRAVKRFTDFALFLSFFPQLVAGPIVRAHEFLPQMKSPPRVTGDHVIEGFHWFLCGLFKKLFIADWLAEYVGGVYAKPQDFDTVAHWWASLAWTAQIYCDFSAYSEMAIGAALFFGFRLPRNFLFPYLASNIAEFWRRWHITLSTWLRDYLYFPLGGNKLGLLKTCRNLMITFFLCGLWHGASWNWIAFGLYHGLLMCIHRIWVQATSGSPSLQTLRANPIFRLAAMGLTLYAVIIGFALVRAESWAGLALILESLLGLNPISATVTVPVWVPILIGFVVVGHLWSGWLKPALGAFQLPVPVKAVAYVTAITALVVLSPGLGKSFIYFQF